jgi:hypothetical protein
MPPPPNPNHFRCETVFVCASRVAVAVADPSSTERKGSRGHAGATALEKTERSSSDPAIQAAPPPTDTAGAHTSASSGAAAGPHHGARASESKQLAHAFRNAFG